MPGVVARPGVVALLVVALLSGGCVSDYQFPIDAPPSAVDAAPDAGAPFVGTIVPLYSYPTETPWERLAAAAAAHPDAHVVAIANADNGPGVVFDPHYADGIAILQAAGVTVIGYVSTSWAARNAGLVQDDIDAWAAYYPTIDGIFFDEMSTEAADVGHYVELDAYATNAGLSFTVGNPGTETDAAYVGVVDVLVIYESAGMPAEADVAWAAQHDAQSFAMIPYAVADPAGFAAFRDTVGYIYVTDDTLPNPWDTLPAYFETLLGD